MPATPTAGPPGVTVVQQLLSPTPSAPPVSSGTAGFIGQHWRGPSLVAVAGTTITDVGGPGDVQLCNSWSDFVKYFGGFNTSSTPVLANSYLAFAVYMFFANGGQSCFVSRVTASLTPGATASATLVDGSATPQATLKLVVGSLNDPGNAGTWGNSIFWGITAMPTTGRFTLSLWLGSLAGQPVETWYDLSMAPTDSRYAPAIINSATSGSLYVLQLT